MAGQKHIALLWKVEKCYFLGIERADTFLQVLSTSNHLSTVGTTIKYFAVTDVQQNNDAQVGNLLYFQFFYIFC